MYLLKTIKSSFLFSVRSMEWIWSSFVQTNPRLSTLAPKKTMSSGQILFYTGGGGGILY